MAEQEYQEEVVETRVKYPTIGNLENAKRAFFNNSFDDFKSGALAKQYKYYNINYKYNSDYDGKPDFIVRNAVGGIAKQFEDSTKYVFAVIRATKEDGKIVITGKVIYNSTSEMNEVIGSIVDDFNWIEVTGDSVSDYLDDFKRNDSLFKEDFVH